MAADDHDEKRDRMVTNVTLLVFAVLLIGGGIWLANAIFDMRRNQDCALSGRKNCAPIATTPGGRETW